MVQWLRLCTSIAGEWVLIPGRGTKASLVAQVVKNPPAMQETQVQSLGQEDPLEKGMATHPLWQATVHGIAKCWTYLSDQLFFSLSFS